MMMNYDLHSIRNPPPPPCIHPGRAAPENESGENYSWFEHVAFCQIALNDMMESVDVAIKHLVFYSNDFEI